MKQTIRFWAVLAMAAMAALPLQAQYEGTTWMQRLGHGKDSLQNYADQIVWSNYSSANSQVAYQHSNDMKVDRTWDSQSYRSWYNLTHGSASMSIFSLYSSGGGADMLRYLLDREPDSAIKKIYFDDLIWLSDFRIDNLDALNSLPDYGPPTKSTLADVKVWKAHYYYTEGKRLPSQCYDKKKARELYADAMKAVRDQRSVTGTEVEDYLIYEYYNACEELYLSDPDKYLETFLMDNLNCTFTCRRLYETANAISDPEKAEQQFNRYYNVYVNVSQRFAKTGAGERQKIEAHYRAVLPERKSDAASMNRAIMLMILYKCLPSVDQPSVIEKYAEEAYKDKEKLTYFTALAYALTLKCRADEAMGGEQRQALRQQMLTAFQEANTLAGDRKKARAEVCFQIAQALNQPLDSMYANNREEIDKWGQDMDGVMKYYTDAMTIDPDHYTVAANFNMELAYRRLAVAYYNVRGDKDASVRRYVIELTTKAIDHANKTIAEAESAYKRHIYEQDDMNMASYQRNAAANAELPQKLQAACQSWIRQWENSVKPTRTRVNPQYEEQMRKYNEWLARKKAEEAFWRGK